MIKLDSNRQAIGTNFVSEVVQLDDGNLATKLVSMKEGVNQTLQQHVRSRSNGTTSSISNALAPVQAMALK